MMLLLRHRRPWTARSLADLIAKLTADLIRFSNNCLCKVIQKEKISNLFILIISRWTSNIVRRGSSLLFKDAILRDNVNSQEI